MFLCWVALQLWWRCNYSEYGNLLFAGKESSRCKPATTRREETNTGTTQMTALVLRVPHAKRSLAKLFNDRAVPA